MLSKILIVPMNVDVKIWILGSDFLYVKTSFVQQSVVIFLFRIERSDNLPVIFLELGILIF